MATVPKFFDDEAWRLWGRLAAIPELSDPEIVEAIRQALEAAYDDGFSAGTYAATHRA